MISFFIENKLIVLSVFIFILCIIIGYIADKKMNEKNQEYSNILNNEEKEVEKENPPRFDKTIKEDDHINNMF